VLAELSAPPTDVLTQFANASALFADIATPAGDLSALFVDPRARPASPVVVSLGLVMRRPAPATR
jgi:hypothetical protein